MKQFNFSSNTDNHKMFLVNYSQLAGRYDPQFHLELPDLTGFVKLSSIANVNGGKRIPMGYDYSQDETEYLYLRVTDFNDEGEIDFKKLRYIDANVFSLLERYEIRNNQIAISIAGTIGRVALVKNIPSEKRVILTENCAKVTLKTDSVLEAYFTLLLNLPIVQKQIELSYIQTTIPKLGLDRIKSLFLPQIPTKQKQEKLIRAYSNAYNSARSKEQQAQKLLTGIDEYLVSELGIVLSKKDNSLQNRIFKIQFNRVSGQRIDPIFYSALNSGLFSSKYDYYKLGEVAHYFKSGFGVGRQDQVEEEYGVIQIRPTNISTLGELIFTKNVYVSPESLAENDYLNYGDVLFNNTNSQELVGKTSYFDIADKELTYSNHITVIKVNQEKLNAVYLQNVLNLYQRNKYFYSICTNWNNQSGVGNELLKSIKIPLPPLNKQEEIVEHIQTIRNKAQQLQTEAAQILADAKAEVERMILGDSGGEPCPPAG